MNIIMDFSEFISEYYSRNRDDIHRILLVLLILLVCISILLAIYTYFLQFSTRNMPPGPFVLPIIGCGLGAWWRRPAIQIWKVRPWEYIDMLAKEFGDIFSFSILHIDAVILTSHEALTEVANMEEFSHKFAHPLYTYPRTMGKELGILFVSSPSIWTEMRKFSFRALREFGFGKEYTMHGVISAEAALLVDSIQSKMMASAGIVSFRNNFSLPVINVLWCMVAGVRYPHDDPTLVNLLDRLYIIVKAITFANPLELVVPLVYRFGPQRLSSALGLSERYMVYEEVNQLSQQLIEARKNEGFYLTGPQNYIDVFLRKIHDDEKNGEQSVYSVEQLQAMLSDFLAVGSMTLNGTLSYGILYLMRNPFIQKKCQVEIDGVVGPNREPTEDDVLKMPYFQAFILELHRVAGVVPNPVPRICPTEWNIRGYKVPKGAVIISNHYSINTSKELWGDPENFRPERFINEAGDFVPDKRVSIFGYGKRMCMGVTLVNGVVPLFLATLLQSFTFSVIPGTEVPMPDPEIGISLSPQDFSVFVVERAAKKKGGRISMPSVWISRLG